jgi:hypothetical protein
VKDEDGDVILPSNAAAVVVKRKASANTPDANDLGYSSILVVNFDFFF